MEKEYQEAVRYLLEIPRFTKKNTLEDTKTFLHKLGDPCGGKLVIHVAGTNGKGSVCAYLSSVLEKAGYRTAMFTSPHLVTMRERFRVDGRMISETDFVRCLEIVKRHIAEGMPGREGYHPTFFETLFFMAMLYFERENAQVIVLETGLGGRLDATNSIGRKDLCILTEIGCDHMEYLGDTIEQIAGEKAGILQKGVPVVFADRRQEATRVILENADRLSCPAFPVSKRDIRNLDFHKNFIDFSYDTGYYGYVRCLLSTAAPYQAENAALTLRALDVLSDKLPVGMDALTEGMRQTRWEGRMEEILSGVYVDGAHNMDGIAALTEAVGRRGRRGRRLLLFSAVREKQYREMTGLLAGGGLFDEIYITEMSNERGLPLKTMEEAFAAAGKRPAACFPKSSDALRTLLRDKRPGDEIYFAGSLYLAGEIKDLVKRNYDDKF